VTAPFDTLVRLTDRLEQLDIPYVVTGSLASAALGEPRSTVDGDVLVAVTPRQLESLMAMLREEFYILEESAREAVRAGRSFNIIHYETSFKIDVYVARDALLDREQIRRPQPMPVASSPERCVRMTSVEDIVLRKLDWHRKGGGESERQWRDVLGVRKVNSRALDRTYLQTMAARLDLTALLARAMTEAGAEESET
jgi:hypothetical protein